MTTRWHHVLGNGLAAFGLVFAVVGAYGVATTEATGGPGTIKIHVESNCGGNDTDPKVGEQFWVGGTGFDAGTERWVAVTDGTNASDPVVIGPISVGSNGSFCSGPHTLAEGHYKAYAGTSSSVVTNSEKTKVFKVECVPPVTDPPITQPPVTEPPVTEPPVTDPPITQPPVTEPPVTDPPVTEPPITQPPVTEPPVTEPPVTQPPATDPPQTDVPTTNGDTTTSVESEAATTTQVDSGGELPTTGNGPLILLLGGLLMTILGFTLRVLARSAS